MFLHLRRIAAATAGGAILASLMLAAPGIAAAKNAATTCWGGAVTPGTYANLVIAGDCFTPGAITVTGNLTVSPGAQLFTAFGGANVWVDGTLSVGTNAVLVLGCEPEAFLCVDDPDFPFGTGTLSAWFHVGGSLVADGALALIVHDGSVAQNLALTGGGGGATLATCETPILFDILPAYATFEDVEVTGNASISGWQSCWLGFFRNVVHGSLNFSNNVTFDPDGNEVSNNWIGSKLNCTGNSPAPQLGDGGQPKNTVLGKASGQCVDLVL